MIQCPRVVRFLVGLALFMIASVGLVVWEKGL